MRIRVAIAATGLLASLIVAVPAPVAATPPSSVSKAKPCGAFSEQTGPCPENDGNWVDVSETRKGSGVSGTTRSWSARSSSEPGAGESSKKKELPQCFRVFAEDILTYARLVLESLTQHKDPPSTTPTLNCPDPQSSPATPAVTITDFAHLAPATTPLTGEPFNVGVAGMPTNFVVPATAHTTTGELFDTPVTVRFTPVRFAFDYGDQHTQSTTTGGYTWQSQGEPQFTPTPTSHVYAESGEYTASATVSYTAELETSTGWTPIPGEITAPTATQNIRIYQAHTALVQYTCTEKPNAPGC